MKSKIVIQLFFLIISIVAYGQEFLNKQTVSGKNYGIYETDFLSADFHQERRNKLRELMPKGAAAIFFANPIRNRSNDVNYEYHQDPNFYYLTGLQEPHAMLMVFKDSVKIKGEMVKEIIFVQQRDSASETWNGKRLGIDGVKNLLNIELVLENKSFKHFKLNFEQFNSIHFIKPQNDVRDNPFDQSDLYDLVLQFDEKVGQLSNLKKSEIHRWMAQLRELKTKEELLLMQKAIEITCEAQIELMKALKPGMKEYQSEAIVEYIFKKNGAEYPGFPSILGGGENSCILHYTTNRKTMLGNDLLVSDIGAEYHGYTADVTRTLPVDGKFSEEEKTIYNIVLAAQQAGIKACQAGNSFWDPNIAATTVISQKLQELGIIKSPIEVRKYFIHGTSHYLGLDVHDVGSYGPLQSNSVITVEPGIYIPAGSDCDEKWWNIGVRIEDDVLITNDEPIVISNCVPKTTDEIETLMSQESYLGK